MQVASFRKLGCRASDASKGRTSESNQELGITSSTNNHDWEEERSAPEWKRLNLGNARGLAEGDWS